MPEITEEIEPQREQRYSGIRPGDTVFDPNPAVEGRDVRGFMLLVTGSEFLAHGEMILN